MAQQQAVDITNLNPSQRKVFDTKLESGSSAINAFADARAPITSNTLGNETPIKLPDTPTPTLSSGMTGKTEGVLENEKLRQEQEQARIDAQAKVDSSRSTLQTVKEKILGIPAEKAQLKEDAGTAQLKETARQASNALIVSQRAQTNELRALKEANLTDTGRASATRDINRKFAFEQADLQLSLHLANSDFNAAQNVINDTIALKLEPLQQEFDFLTQVLEDNKDIFNKEDQRLFELKRDKVQETLIRESQRLKLEGDLQLANARRASGGGNGVDEKPLSINQIEQFRRSFNWTPPFGFTQSQLLQFMQDNPNLTPQQLEAEAKKVSGGDVSSQAPQVPTTSETPAGVVTYITTTMTDEQLKRLKRKADQAGISSAFKNKRTDVKNYLNSPAILKAIQDGLNAGLTKERMLEMLTE